jgi:hypothetical protein
VDSRSGSQGVYTLRGTFEPPPANDHFANRTPIENSAFLMQYGYVRHYGWNVGATKEAGEPWHGGATYTNHGGKSVWWTWTAPASGRATVGALPLRYVFSSLVGVYTGSAVNSLVRIGNAYSTCTAGSAGVLFPVTAGTTYQFAIDGDGSGEYELTLDVDLDTSAPTAAITQPTAGQVLDAATLTVTGTAADPAAPGSINYSSGLNLVEVRLNGGAWLPATGTSTWSRALTLTAGSNLIEARARDLVGNESTLAAVEVTYGSLSPFATWVNPFGITNPADKTKPADPDGDGLNNLGEFALDGDPTSGTNNGKIVGKIAPVGGVDVLTLTLPVRNGTVLDPADPAGGELGLKQTADGLFYKIQATDPLTAWSLTVSEVTGHDADAIQLGLPLPNPGWTYRSFRSPGPVAGDPIEFMRVEISD